jgi:nucleotide-binding universal stress UspA family protein
MFEKILYPTDFSEVAGTAVKFIVKLKEAGAKEVVVLHVIDIRLATITEYDMSSVVTYEKGFKVTTRIETGIPYKEILRVEKEEDATLMVIGSHGKSNIAEMLIGSVSEKAARNSKIPVLIVKR